MAFETLQEKDLKPTAKIHFNQDQSHSSKINWKKLLIQLKAAAQSPWEIRNKRQRVMVIHLSFWIPILGWVVYPPWHCFLEEGD